MTCIGPEKADSTLRSQKLPDPAKVGKFLAQAIFNFYYFLYSIEGLTGLFRPKVSNFRRIVMKDIGPKGLHVIRLY